MNVVTLPPVVDTAAAEALKNQLLDHLRNRKACQLDGSAVERIGTAGLQVLRSAQVSFAENGLDFDLGRLSPALIQALVMAGLDGPTHFNLMMEQQ